MYNSKIKQIIIENFGSIEYAEIEFDDSNILNLCGYNDSGKSNVIRLLSMLLYDVHPTEQVNFVKDGKEYWRGTLIFDDDVRISKTKMLTGASIWEMSVGDKVLYSNKLGVGYSSVKGGVPAQIASYLGVLRDDFTKQLLNVRFNTDKMFLIYTTGSENYKMLSSVLKSDELAEASATLIQAKNKLDQEVQVKNNTYNILVSQHNELDVAPKSTIEELDSKVEALTELNKRGKVLSGVEEAHNIIQQADIYPELKAIDTSRLRTLEGLRGFAASASVAVQPELSNIDTNKYNTLKSLIANYENTKTVVQPALSSIDTTRIGAVCDLIRAKMTYENAVASSQSIEAEYEKCYKELQEIAVQTGFKVCKNCGSVVM